MVEYSKWTEVVFAEAPSSADATEIISFAAKLWRQNKADLKAATVSEARAFASDQI